MRLVCLCASTRASSEQAQQIRALAATVADWNAILVLATNNGVLPLVGSTLRAVAGDILPAATAKTLATHGQQVAFETMRLSGELLKLIRAFEAVGVRAIAFKGPTLGSFAYGNIALRPFGDLDILVAPADVAAAVRVLAAHGFPGWEESRDIAAHLQGECEETFVRHDGRVTVDLHWALSRSYLPFDIPFDTLWSRARQVRVGGQIVSTLSPEDLLPFLCLHGGKHQWERLQWVCDIAELVRARPELDVVAALRQSTAVGQSRVLLLGLALAKSLLDLPLPAEVERKIAGDRTIEKLMHESTGSMFAHQGSQPEKSQFKRQCRASMFHLKMQRRLRDKLRYVLQAAAPNPRDRGYVSLPRGLQFLYVLGRPVRLFKRYLLPGG